MVEQGIDGPEALCSCGARKVYGWKLVHRGLVYPSDSLETSSLLEVEHSFRSWSISDCRENCNALFVVACIIVGFDIVVTVHCCLLFN